MGFRRSVLFIAAVFAATAASGEVLECKLKPNASAGGYITELYYFESGSDGTSARVADGLTQFFEGGPVSAEIATDSSSKRVYNWAVTTKSSTGQVTVMRFRAAYLKGDKSIVVAAVPDADYVGRFEGRGKCKVVQ